MEHFKIDSEIVKSDILPSFSLTIDGSSTASLYSDTEMQSELVRNLRKNGKISIFDTKDEAYRRLTVEDNISFYHKWFGCDIPVPEILVFFELQTCAKIPLHKCSDSEVRRVSYARYYMSGVSPMVFREPIHDVDVKTINIFINMTTKLKEQSLPVLVLVSNMEHALLLGERAYQLNNRGLKQIEVDEEEEEIVSDPSIPIPTTANLFKIPAKVGDKMILFDPPEIDYIESQDGKVLIVVNDQSYALDSTLGEIEKKLDIYGFYRCHRSYIVNLQKVREIITWSKNTYSLRIDNKLQSTIPLSRTKIQDIQEKFSLK